MIDWAYLLLDGVWVKVRRAFGPQRVLLLVAYGMRANGERQLLAFTRARGESQASWESFLWNLHERGLAGRQLQLVLTDGCAGLAAAIETIYPRARQQRCWVHKMRDGVRRRDQAQLKQDAQRIYWPATPRRLAGPFGASVSTGRPLIPRWSGGWSAPCPSCSRFSISRSRCGASCAPPTPSSAASWK